ncbi:hypothetical protein PIIN_11819 [Serendipita indica DSM 11827]|uniref:USP domain-containing protein n=1 Tax=Serendipita indica (strain DSM 11827) TaxID=1109443 RepID=G4U0Z9_SERID|nr:hypothetical protein PIIN_11819 [Serendipita indica DSM 11827]
MKRRKLQETRAKGNVIRASKWRISIRKLSPESEENSAGDEEWPKQSIESNSKVRRFDWKNKATSSDAEQQSRRSRALANEPQPRPSSLPAPPVGIPNMGNNCFMVAVFRGWATIPAMRKAWASLLLSARTGEVVTILSGRNELSRSVSERKPPSISTNVAKLRASISTLVFSLDGQETALQFHLQIVTQLRRSHNPFQTWSQIIRLNDSAIPP